MRHGFTAVYRGWEYAANVGPTSADVMLYADDEPPPELGFESGPGYWRRRVQRSELDRLSYLRTVGFYRGQSCLVLGDRGERLHIAYLGHDAYEAEFLGYWMVDRGAYEVVVPRADVTDLTVERVDYPTDGAAVEPVATGETTTAGGETTPPATGRTESAESATAPTGAAGSGDLPGATATLPEVETGATPEFPAEAGGDAPAASIGRRLTAESPPEKTISEDTGDVRRFAGSDDFDHARPSEEGEPPDDHEDLTRLSIESQADVQEVSTDLPPAVGAASEQAGADTGESESPPVQGPVDRPVASLDSEAWTIPWMRPEWLQNGEEPPTPSAAGPAPGPEQPAEPAERPEASSPEQSSAKESLGTTPPSAPEPAQGEEPWHTPPSRSQPEPPMSWAGREATQPTGPPRLGPPGWPEPPVTGEPARAEPPAGEGVTATPPPPPATPPEPQPAEAWRSELWATGPAPPSPAEPPRPPAEQVAPSEETSPQPWWATSLESERGGEPAASSAPTQSDVESWWVAPEPAEQSSQPGPAHPEPGARREAEAGTSPSAGAQLTPADMPTPPEPVRAADVWQAVSQSEPAPSAPPEPQPAEQADVQPSPPSEPASPPAEDAPAPAKDVPESEEAVPEAWWATSSAQDQPPPWESWWPQELGPPHAAEEAAGEVAREPERSSPPLAGFVDLSAHQKSPSPTEPTPASSAPREEREEEVARDAADTAVPTADETPPLASSKPAGAGTPLLTDGLEWLSPRRIFVDLAERAGIAHELYAIDEIVDDALCLVRTDDGFDVFYYDRGLRQGAQHFDDEEAAYYYLFGRLAALALRSGRLIPS